MRKNTSSSSKAASTLHSGGSQWEVLSARKELLINESFAVPCMPRTRGAVNEPHRQPINQLIQQRIKRLEFKPDIEMWDPKRKLPERPRRGRRLISNGTSLEPKVFGTKSLFANSTT